MDNRNVPPAVEEPQYEDPPRDVQRRWNWDITWVVGAVAVIFVVVIIGFIVFYN